MIVDLNYDFEIINYECLNFERKKQQQSIVECLYVQSPVIPVPLFARKMTRDLEQRFRQGMQYLPWTNIYMQHSSG